MRSSKKNSTAASELVADASPLILLSRIDRLDLLAALSDGLLEPRSVMTEIVAGSDRDTAADSVRAASCIDVVDDVIVPEAVSVWDLGRGESQALSVALAKGEREAVIDDRAARRCAESLGVPVRGTLGIVTLSRQRNIIPVLQPVLDELAEHGMWLSPKLRAAALAAVGEHDSTWLTSA